MIPWVWPHENIETTKMRMYILVIHVCVILLSLLILLLYNIHQMLVFKKEKIQM